MVTAAAAGSVIYNIWKPVKSKLPVVEDFELEKYLGEWYEIARIDFFWEKDLKNVKALYQSKSNGAIKVTNTGVNLKSSKDKKSIGKAKFNSTSDRGDLLVSFFGPFYSGYNIMHVDENYQSALIFGDNLDYLWILSRNKTIDEKTKKMYLDYAEKAGYELDRLTWTIQD